MDVPETILQRLERYFEREAILRILGEPSLLFGGLSPIDFVRAGHSWDEVLAAYERVFSYEVTE